MMASQPGPGRAAAGPAPPEAEGGRRRPWSSVLGSFSASARCHPVCVCVSRPPSSHRRPSHWLGAHPSDLALTRPPRHGPLPQAGLV